MKISVISDGAKHHIMAANIFKEGLNKHGIKYKSIERNSIEPCDLLVGWGGRSLYPHKNKCKDFLMMEAAYLEPRVDKNHWPLNISLGYNGLNGKATFVNKGKDSSRWDKLFNDGRLKEWRKGGTFILVTGQVPGDQSIRSLNVNYPDICKKVCAETDHSVLFKPHPRGPMIEIKGSRAKVTTVKLDQLLRSCIAVVTVNSNSGVDSVINGVPVLALDKGSMCWDICMKDYTQLSNIEYPDRQQWLNELAWCQWFPEEISSGDAWEHLKNFYD